MTTSSTTTSSTDVRASLDLFDLGNGKRIGVKSLQNLLPDVETALFFAKAYDLDYRKLSELLSKLFRTDPLAALMEGGHSESLQDYLVDTIPPDIYPEDAPDFVDAPPPGQVLPQLWESLEVQVAQSIKDVAAKLAGTLDMLPGKQGQMVFNHMARLNRQRPTIGTFEASIKHSRQAPNLVVLDDSGSMSSQTISRIIEDVVALSWKADAHLVLVSNTARHWEPGSYNVDAVLAAGQYGGTHYETLTPLLQRNWGTVVTIADYDSSRSAKEYIRTHARGRISQLLDISLVNRSTFLAECLGQIADEVRPLLIGSSGYVLT